jgi:hypothetical protein
LFSQKKREKKKKKKKKKEEEKLEIGVNVALPPQE